MSTKLWILALWLSFTFGFFGGIEFERSGVCAYADIPYICPIVVPDGPILVKP